MVSIVKRQELYVPGFTLMTGNLYTMAIQSPNRLKREDQLSGGGGDSGPPPEPDNVINNTDNVINDTDNVVSG